MDNHRSIRRDFRDPRLEPGVRNAQSTPKMTAFMLGGTTDVQYKIVRFFGHERRQFAKFNRPDAGKVAIG